MIFAKATSAGGDHQQERYRRLSSMVDWYSDTGDLVSLHSDHSISSRHGPIEFTEVVFLETSDLRNYLVLVNGAEPQNAKGITLRIRNHRDQIRQAVYASEIAPFSLHKLNLSELFPGLCEFAEGRHVTLDGEFDCRNLFCRPYVMTEGKYLSGYHGGDRYQWKKTIPRFVYKAMGRGEVNPMVAIQSDRLRTTVNIFNSHGDLEEDFWVDARLYDESGKEVARRKRWLLARRHGLSRGEIGDLLEPNRLFKGHIALNFSDDERKLYPRRLQALLEYRTDVSTARVMAWSDVWNGRTALRTLRDKLTGVFPLQSLYHDEYLGAPGIVYRSHYRIWFRPPIRSYIAVTNSGIAENYAETVSYTIKLFNSRGESIECTGSLGPNATDFDCVSHFFPTGETFLAPGGIGVASVESQADLAVMHLSQHDVSGVFSAEHFLASVNRHDGKQYASCGA